MSGRLTVKEQAGLQIIEQGLSELESAVAGLREKESLNQVRGLKEQFVLAAGLVRTGLAQFGKNPEVPGELPSLEPLLKMSEESWKGFCVFCEMFRNLEPNQPLFQKDVASRLGTVPSAVTKWIDNYWRPLGLVERMPITPTAKGLALLELWQKGVNQSVERTADAAVH